jgi:integrase
LRVFLGWLLERQTVEKNELDRVRMAGRETPRSRVLSDNELKRLIERTKDATPFSDIVKVLLRSAMRRGEAAALQPRDLDFGAMTIKVREEVSKTSRARTIPMGAELVEMLRGRSTGLAPDGYLFGDGSGFERPFAGFSKLFAKMWATMPASVEKFTLHDIRRTIATRLHEASVDALTIEDLLGHLTGVRGGIAGVYNAARTLDRQRRALAGWSATLAALETSIGAATELPPASPANATRLGVPLRAP